MSPAFRSTLRDFGLVVRIVTIGGSLPRHSATEDTPNRNIPGTGIVPLSLIAQGWVRDIIPVGRQA